MEEVKMESNNEDCASIGGTQPPTGRKIKLGHAPINMGGALSKIIYTMLSWSRVWMS